MFYAHTGLCNKFEAVLVSWVHTFLTEFMSFCWCYNLGQKNLCLRLPDFSFEKVATLNFFRENLKYILEDLYFLTKK